MPEDTGAEPNANGEVHARSHMTAEIRDRFGKERAAGKRACLEPGMSRWTQDGEEAGAAESS